MQAVAPVCPRCGQQAPLVYRGVVPYCTACGALRGPLTSSSVNLAGQPSRVGGTFTSVLGWLILLAGGSVAIGLGGLLAAFGAWQVGLALAAPIAFISIVLGIVLVRGGRSIVASGAQKAQATRDQALYALAAHRGAVTAHEAGIALGISTADADGMLTDLAKREPERMGLDVDDQGILWYRLAPGAGQPMPRMRVVRGRPGRIGCPGSAGHRTRDRRR